MTCGIVASGLATDAGATGAAATGAAATGAATIGGGVVACGMRAGSAGIGSPVGVGSGAFATAALPCAEYVAVPTDVEFEPQLAPFDCHGFAGAAGVAAFALPQLGPFDGTLETGENVAGMDEIARGFVNGMTFADTR